MADTEDIITSEENEIIGSDIDAPNEDISEPSSSGNTDIPEDDLSNSDTPVIPDEPETPVIELIVETGNHLENANSYVDLDFANKYNAERGRTSWNELDDESKKRCLVLGTDYIDHFYKWNGIKATQYQALAFPRIKLVDADGYWINGIPLNLKKAVVEAAYLNIDADTLFEVKDSNGGIKREKVDVLETEYFGKGVTVDYSSIYTILNSLLEGLYRTADIQNTFNVGALWLK